MKLTNLFFSKTPLCNAIEKGNKEMMKILLSCQNIDANIPYTII